MLIVPIPRVFLLFFSFCFTIPLSFFGFVLFFFLLEFLSLGRSTDFGIQLLLLAQNLLILHQNLLSALDDLNLHFFFAQTLLCLGGLQLVGQFSFGFLEKKEEKTLAFKPQSELPDSSTAIRKKKKKMRRAESGRHQEGKEKGKRETEARNVDDVAPKRVGRIKINLSRSSNMLVPGAYMVSFSFPIRGLLELHYVMGKSKSIFLCLLVCLLTLRSEWYVPNQS